MNISKTVSRLDEMRLTGMSSSYSERRSKPDHKDLSFDEFFGLVVEDEYTYRKNKKIKRLLRDAKFKIPSACIEEIDYKQPRGVNKSQVVNLQNTTWLEKYQNILITGATGVGKTYFACAFGTWACRNGFSALYFRWPRLFGNIMSSNGEGNYLKYLKKLSRANLLIIDDFGLTPIPASDRKDLLEVIEDRYMAGSTIITSQLPIKEWHDFIGEPTISDAVMDRILHVSYKFELKGASMRKKQS